VPQSVGTTATNVLVLGLNFQVVTCMVDTCLVLYWGSGVTLNVDADVGPRFALGVILFDAPWVGFCLVMELVAAQNIFILSSNALKYVANVGGEGWVCSLLEGHLCL
jgi:hypothetical protein